MDNEEQVRLRQQQDQWIAMMGDMARQCKYLYDLLLGEGLSELASATITGHWIGASVVQQGTNAQFEELLSLVRGEEPE